MIMKLKKSTKAILAVILISVVAVVLFLLDNGTIGNNHTKQIVMLSAIYAVIGVSMNLVNGFTGIFSLGQAGFMAIGAYVVGVFTIDPAVRSSLYYVTPISDSIVNVYIPFWAALLIGGVIAVIFAALIGAPVLKLKSDYLAIATLGFSEIIRVFFSGKHMEPFTNGSMGLKAIPKFSTIFTPILISAVCIGIMVLLINSTYGRAFKAIREDEVAAEAMGINLFKHKQLSFVTSAFFAAVGGGLLAACLGTVDPNQFKITITYELLLIVVLGGMGSVTGTIIASFLITAGKEWLRFFDNPMTIGGVSIPIFRPGLRMVIFSILLMVIVLFYRRGIMGMNEFSWDGIANFLRFNKKAKTGGGADE